jgi:hypothetical protein
MVAQPLVLLVLFNFVGNFVEVVVVDLADFDFLYFL